MTRINPAAPTNVALNAPIDNDRTETTTDKPRVQSFPVNLNGAQLNPNETLASRNGIDTQNTRAQIQSKLNKPDLNGLTPEQKELVLDLLDVGLSVAGIFDPTPISDGAGAGLALSRGDFWGAGINVVGMIPYLGDLAKLGKLPKLVKIIENVVNMAKTDAKFAKAVEGLLGKMKSVLGGIPPGKLPDPLREAVEAMKKKIDEFFAARKVGKLTIEPGRTLSASEQKIADKLVAEGKNVTARVESTAKGVKNPDFEVNGVVTEFKHVSDLKGADPERLSKGLSGRILDGASQAKHVILDVADQPGMTKEIAERAVRRAFGRQAQLVRAGDLPAAKITEVRIIGKDFDITIPFVAQ